MISLVNGKIPQEEMTLGRTPAKTERAKACVHLAESGMTLIEIMIAIAILAMVTTALWTGFAQSGRTQRHVTARTDFIHGVRQTLNRLSRELSMAYVSVHVNPATQLQTVRTAFVGDDRSNGDRIDFTSFSHRRLVRNAHESDQNEIAYFVTRHPEDARRKVLARREQRRVDDDPLKGGTVELVLEDVESFELTYLDPISQQWLESWDTSQAALQANRLPARVKIQLSVIDPNKEVRTFTTQVEIPMVYALNHARYNS